MDADRLTEAFEQARPELLAYLTRLVVRVAVAEELVQETALRALEALDRAPADPADARPWLFRIATNLAIDHRRRHGTLRETLLADGRRHADASPEFAAASATLRGSPEMAAVAREHLVACFACTLGQLPAEQAAALLLREVYDFTTDQIAEILDARFAQVKHWLQQARAAMEARYAGTCALVGKQGVCYQCVELDGFYAAGRGDPLAGTDGRLDDRLRVVRELRAAPPGTWAHLLSGVLEEIG